MVECIGPTHTHRYDPYIAIEPLPGSRIAAGASLLDTTHLACPLDSLPTEPSIPGWTAASLRLHHRDTQWHATRRVSTGGASGGPSQPDTGAVGV